MYFREDVLCNAAKYGKRSEQMYILKCCRSYIAGSEGDNIQMLCAGFSMLAECVEYYR